MAKKGGPQQVQAELNNDDEFERFLDRPGLIVLDVYSEWCGPCLGMVGSLKKIKLEQGDNLHLAICKSDTISHLNRFRGKSEPTWLFVRNGKAINLMFGVNVPKLMKLIITELNLLASKTPRVEYAIAELQPEEEQRRKVKEDTIAAAEHKELMEKEKKRTDYLKYVTDVIMENMPDIGVTVFGPQVSREMFKKIMEPAEALKIQCKDRKVVAVTKENFDVVNFVCKNPIPEIVLEQLYQRELLVCFWKMPEDSSSAVAKTLEKYAHALTTAHTEPPDDYNEEERVTPPILTPMEVKIEVELEEGEEYEEEIEEHPSIVRPMEELDDEESEEEAEEDEEGNEEPPPPPLPTEFDMGFDEMNEEEEDEDGEGAIEEPPKKRTRMKTIDLPPVWVASDPRTHAALIYVFFRSQTAPFLAPDPIPEPPHLIMAFDAYKKKDLIDLAERHKDDVPLYGFFTSDDVSSAQYIANSSSKYASQPHTPTDKIVFKVNKKTSQTMLSLATYGPTYVSANTVIGREEALKFFPEDYKTAEMEASEVSEERPSVVKKKKKKKDSVSSTSEAPPKQKVAAEAEVAPAIVEEGVATSSGEDSGESRPPSADGATEEVAEQ